MTAHLAEAHPMWLPHFQDGPVVASEEGGNVHMARHVHPFYFTSWFNEQLMMDFISSLPSNDSTKRQMALLRDMAFKLNFTPPKKKILLLVGNDSDIIPIISPHTKQVFKLFFFLFLTLHCANIHRKKNVADVKGFFFSPKF